VLLASGRRQVISWLPASGAGERRSGRGCIAIPAIVRDIDDSTCGRDRSDREHPAEDLNAIEEAEGYKQLIDRFGHSQEDVAGLVHKSRSHVANLLRLLELPAPVKQCYCVAISAWAMRGQSPPLKIPRNSPARSLRTRAVGAPGGSACEAGEAENRREGGGRATGSRRPTPISPRSSASSATCSASRSRFPQRPQRHRDLHYSSLDQLDMICQRLSGEQSKLKHPSAAAKGRETETRPS
jgi:ParB family transcriptional regulator, chromosome partitioning protein